jgi:hypothetical protein
MPLAIHVLAIYRFNQAIKLIIDQKDSQQCSVLTEQKITSPLMI